ncbi:hypothetical protein SERLA73DRAFT_170228 [Serpula lacrymans var. lacrymans S7.3]|uniref:VPS9 domain-containing protein n=1 Tax=Serpula lacrymans var. lacrymans (strain S7.3) TaxID=936435 RepID=F8Q407_SERL3|nr:hypothetical protein SERLA73DRAFT_170228 [Serpula lacrymans var. lacrymans S7.3]
MDHDSPSLNEPLHGSDSLTNTLGVLQISQSGSSSQPDMLPAPSFVPPTESPNPWDDRPPPLELKQVHTPEPSSLDPSMNALYDPASPQRSNIAERASKEVLSEFDPLASHEEMAAREAWADAEGHPPPRPQTPQSPRPSSPRNPTHSRSGSKDVSREASSSRPSSPAPSSSSSFPSLAALARTFSIQSKPRIRPISLDTAQPIQSPSTLSSFAQQQQAPSPSPLQKQVHLQADPRGSSPGSRSSTPQSGSESPRPTRDKDPTFDFQKFLDQMKMKGAEPVGKYLRSFLSNFAKRTFTVNDQVKIINDFLNFISVKMRECDIWRHASDAEIDNAMEGMEKLVMNRLYEFTFTPQVARMLPPRPITADDLERDRVLSQRIALFGWVEEKHLDIPVGEGSKGFLMFAQQELLKVNHYKAPRDKLICILNSCKVIFGLIRHLHKEEGADSFIPILIFVVLKANPDHLLSNVEFINRFRNPAKLQSEAGYYLSSLMGAVSFIETMDHTSLSNTTQEEFERNVEEAIQSLPPSEPQSPTTEPTTSRHSLSSSLSSLNAVVSPHAGEESAQPLALSTPGQTLGEDAKRLLQKTGDTISKPLNAIGRIFTEALDEKLTYLPGPFAPFEIGREARSGQQRQGGTPQQWAQADHYAAQSGSALLQTPVGAGEGGQQVGPYAAPIQTPYKPRVRRVPSPAQTGSMPVPTGVEETPTRRPYTNQPLAIGPSHNLATPGLSPSQHVSRTPTPRIDYAGLQVEIDQAHERAAVASRETLVQIFPGMDKEIIELVLEANSGDLGKSIEGLLEMSSGT